MNDKIPEEGFPMAARELKVLNADGALLAHHEGETCKLCNEGPQPPFSMAFQPIVDVEHGTIMAYEALVRGPHGEAARSVLDHTLQNRYAMDQRCRERAIVLSESLGILDGAADLYVNFYPNAILEPDRCLKRSLQAASALSFPLTRIVFEMTEMEEVQSLYHLRRIVDEYRAHGLRVAIDDFGAGHSGLNLLSEFQPDIIKIDRALVDRIDRRPASLSIVRSIAQVCRDLDIRVVAEGIERTEEKEVLCELGIFLMQGFYFAHPAFEALPSWP